MVHDFNEEELGFRDVLRDYLSRECAAPAQRGKLDEGALDAHDARIWRGLAELGLFAACVPESLGGLGLGLRQWVLPLEELGAALVPGPVADTLACTWLLSHHASDALQREQLPRLALGERKACLALLDDAHHYDPHQSAVRAVRSGGQWRLTGRKLLVPQAAASDLIIVSAQESAEGPVLLFLCERDAPGISLREHATMDPGTRYHALSLDAAPALGAPLTDAHARLQRLATWMATGQLIGVAARALRMAVDYASQRKQFGQPIGSFQAIKHLCADMHVGLEMSRAAYQNAGWCLADDEPDAAMAVSVAKAYASDACRAILYDSLQVHGGMGFTWDYGLHYYIKRGKYLEHAFGNATWQREAVAQAMLSTPAPAA